LPPVPQIVHSFYDPNQQPIVHLGWQRVQDVEQFQIWRGLKGDYQSLIFQAAYGDTNSYSAYVDTNSYEDLNPDGFYPGQTYFYQIKFINAAGSSSSEIIRLNVPEPSFCPLYLQAQYEFGDMAEAIQAPPLIKLSFTIDGQEVSDHELEYQIERGLKGAVDPFLMVESKTKIKFSDEETVDVVYYDQDVLPYREYTYSITTFDRTSGVEAQKIVTVNTTDIESLLKIAPPDLLYIPQDPEEMYVGGGVCFIAAVAH